VANTAPNNPSGTTANSTRGGGTGALLLDGPNPKLAGARQGAKDDASLKAEQGNAKR